MRPLLRIVAIIAAISVLGTVWFIATFAAHGGLRPLVASGLLGVLTIVGWIVALLIGPVAAVQLWRLRESGRRAGIIFFGYGVGYYMVGLLGLRTPQASLWSIVSAALMFALPLAVLLLPRARAVLSGAPSQAAG